MSSKDTDKVLAFASIDIDNRLIGIERSIDKDGIERIHLYSRSKEEQPDQPPALSEAELLELLQQAILMGVLSRDFIGRLRERMEI
jgi:hypothetical protein